MVGTAIATSGTAGLITGLLIGVLIGLALGPILRSWLTWREYVSASRQVPLADEVLRRLGEEPGKEDHPAPEPRAGVGSNQSRGT
jgi:hypothetical protein